MIIRKENINTTSEYNSKGEEKLYLSDLTAFPDINPKIRMYALAELKPGEEVEFHTHTDECELYYILSGKGVYDDNGKEYEVQAGTVTHTPSGSGHGIRNTGNEMLKFMALIIRD